MTTDAAAQVVADLARWRVHAPVADDVLAAVDIHARGSLSFWDALLVRGASVLCCEVLYTEEFNPGQRYAGVSVVDPFAPDWAATAPYACCAPTPDAPSCCSSAPTPGGT